MTFVLAGILKELGWEYIQALLTNKNGLNLRATASPYFLKMVARATPP